MSDIDSNSKQSDLLELLWEMRASEPNRSVSSMLEELRLTKLAENRMEKGQN